MSQVRMDIASVVVGGGPVASLVVLKPRHDSDSSVKLPIRIGPVEAAAIGMGVDPDLSRRPLTHDLFAQTIRSLDAHLDEVVIHSVKDTTFFAQLAISTDQGSRVVLDARPSDAIALAVRTKAPIFAEQEVLDTASMPDFDAVERDEKQREAEAFHEFVEGLSPDDFVG